MIELDLVSEHFRGTRGVTALHVISLSNARGETVAIDGELVFLRDYLHSHGYPGAFEGHFNTGRIIGISPDGRTIVGHNGGPFGSINRYGFIVILPELDEQ
jgi:hypothetical protein